MKKFFNFEIFYIFTFVKVNSYLSYIKKMNLTFKVNEYK